jgi:hypothetical protein
MQEFSVSYKRIGLVLLLIAVIVIYFLLYNKWEQMTTIAAWNRAMGGNNKEGFTDGVAESAASVLKATDMAIGYQGIEDGSYTVDTLSEQMLGYINPILAQVLNQINTKTGARYYLRKIDRVNVVPIDKGFIGCELAGGSGGTALKSACPAVDAATHEIQLGVRYTVDFFAHELTNQDTHRFIVVFTVNSQGEIQVEHFNISNGQIQPDKMFPTTAELHTDPLAKPDNLIFTDAAFSRATSGNKSIMGIPTGTAEFSLFKPEGVKGGAPIVQGWNDSAQLGQIFLPGMFQSDNTPPGVPKTTSLDATLEQQPPFNPNWPQRKHGRWWDEFGVANVENCSPDRRGLDHAIDQRPTQVYDNPTVVRSEGNAYENANHWLFNRARGSLRQAMAN